MTDDEYVPMIFIYFRGKFRGVTKLIFRGHRIKDFVHSEQKGMLMYNAKLDTKPVNVTVTGYRGNKTVIFGVIFSPTRQKSFALL